jgi:hypothetical protein
VGTLKNGSRERGNNEKANISLAEASEIKFDSQQDTTVEEFNQFWKAFPPSYIPMFIFIAITLAKKKNSKSTYLFIQQKRRGGTGEAGDDLVITDCGWFI